MKNQACAISGKKFTSAELIRFSGVDPDLQKFIQKKHLELKQDSLISYEQLVLLEQEQVNYILTEELGAADELKQDLMKSIRNNSFLSAGLKSGKKDTVGERIADKVASFGGSWTFIIIFFSFLLAWMALNAFLLANRGFDPYPFILLNLILSCLAAIQAPIIMMSQNRQEAKDRERAEHDYKINLKAELEIKLLHKKIDHILAHHNRHLLEIQRVQTDMLEHLTKELETKPRRNASAGTKPEGKKDSSK